MPKKRTKPTKASSVVKKASCIYDEQKATYQKMLKTKVRQGKKVTTAAKEASETYKKLYGATPTARWKRALREAKHQGGVVSMTTYEWITTFMGPVCGFIGWIAGRRIRRNETIKALQTTIDMLVEKNKELYDEIMRLRKENDNRINELEMQIEKLKK